ncbi:hypothetical protein ALC62_01075, partial [Cyphomyrmex costatus]
YDFYDDSILLHIPFLFFLLLSVVDIIGCRRHSGVVEDVVEDGVDVGNNNNDVGLERGYIAFNTESRNVGRIADRTSERLVVGSEGTLATRKKKRSSGRPRKVETTEETLQYARSRSEDVPLTAYTNPRLPQQPGELFPFRFPISLQLALSKRVRAVALFVKAVLWFPALISGTMSGA